MNLISHDSDYKLHKESISFLVDSGGSEPNASLLEQYERNQKIEVFDMFKLALLLGVTCFGGPKQQQDIFYTTMIKEKKIIMHKDFVQLYSLCSVIPGPTTTQLLLSICLIKTERLWGSIAAVIGFYLPSLLIVLLIAYIFRLFKEYSIVDIDLTTQATEPDYFIINLKIIGTSICQASVALILQSAYYHTCNLIFKSKFQLVLMTLACLISIAFPSFYFMLAIMICCGIASVYKKDHDYLLDNATIKLDIGDTPLLGITSLMYFVLIYFVLILFRIFFGHLSYNFILAESFYRIGSLSFAGGYSVIPLLLSEYNAQMEEYEFLHGYAVLSLLPGPILNIAVYVGVLVNGLISGILSIFFIVLPGVLLILAVLPYSEYLKKNAMIQHFLRGATSAFIGFIFSAAFRLWVDSTVLSPYATIALGTLNVILCFLMLETFKIYTPVVLITSAAVSAIFAFLQTKLVKFN
jgi:chromate transporter